jgi:hypothetical protein
MGPRWEKCCNLEENEGVLPEENWSERSQAGRSTQLVDELALLANISVLRLISGAGPRSTSYAVNVRPTGVILQTPRSPSINRV